MWSEQLQYDLLSLFSLAHRLGLECCHHNSQGQPWWLLWVSEEVLQRTRNILHQEQQRTSIYDKNSIPIIPNAINTKSPFIPISQRYPTCTPCPPTVTPVPCAPICAPLWWPTRTKPPMPEPVILALDFPFVFVWETICSMVSCETPKLLNRWWLRDIIENKCYCQVLSLLFGLFSIDSRGFYESCFNSYNFYSFYSFLIYSSS